MHKLNTSYKPSERISFLRERALKLDPEICSVGARSYYFMKGWMESAAQSLPMRSCMGLKSVINNMPIKGIKEDLLLGEHGNPGWHEFINFWPGGYANLEEFLQTTELSEDQKQDMRNWMAQKPFDWITLAPVAPWPAEMQIASDRGVIQIWGTDLNHSIRNYEKVH